jgi:hypothetical protein
VFVVSRPVQTSSGVRFGSNQGRVMGRFARPTPDPCIVSSRVCPCLSIQCAESGFFRLVGFFRVGSDFGSTIVAHT